MLNVGIGHYPVPSFRLTEQYRGRVLDSPSLNLVSAASCPRCQSDGEGPTEKSGLRGEGFKRAEIPIAESVAAWKFFRFVPMLDSARQPDS
jgi:hypothetical protein